MASITFATRTNFNVNAVRVKMEAIAANRARAACETIGPQTCQFIADEAASKLQENYRGRGHRSQSLMEASSYGFDVTRQANGARLNIHIMGGDDFKAKFFSCNYGRGGGQPVYPKGNYKLAWIDRAGSKQGRWKTKQGAFAGVGFYEAGIARGVALIPGAI